MKHVLPLLLLIFVLNSSSLFSQVSSYNYTQTTTAFAFITGGTVAWNTTFDDNVTGAVTIPNFKFNCNIYNQVFISSNGFISFGNAPSVISFPLSDTEGSGVIAAFATDLESASVGTPEVRYQNITASNEFVIQWRDVTRYGITGERISFQIRLNYLTNTIRIVYGGTITADATTFPGVQVGLRGATNTDFVCRTTATNWNTTTLGAFNTDECVFSGAIKPASGLTFQYAPVNMTFVAATTAQASTLGAQKCRAGEEIIRIEINTNGCNNALSLNQISMNMLGSTIPGTSTNDVSLIHVYYTGNSSIYSSAVPFDGLGTAVAGGAILINGNQTLTSGTNYFWIAYDMNNASSTIGNTVDARCTSLNISGTPVTPSITNPAGSRSIIVCLGAPGGVNNGLSAWYKADNSASVILASGVSSWNNTTGSATGFNLTQSTVAQRPGLISGAINPKLFNYNPRIDFIAASNTFLGNGATSPELMSPSGSYFVVNDNSNDDFTGFTYSPDLVSYAHQYKPGFRAQSNDDSFNGWTFDWTAPSEYSNFSAYMTSSSGSGATQVINKNSVSIAASNSNDFTYTPQITTGLYLGRNNMGGEDTDANIAELIFYSTTLSTLDKNKVESYLAIKYGLTRGTNSGVSAIYNYISSSGQTIWNKTSNVGYNRDIAGIGKDDASALIQKQSISVNNNEPVTIGLQTIASSNQTNSNLFSSDQSFLVWGNNGLLNQITANPICFSNLPAGIYGRIERVWKSQLTNFNQLVTVGFETSMLVGFNPISNLRLLVDNDGVNWTNATIYTGAVLNGTRIEFPGVVLSSATPFFTLATTSALTPLPVELVFFEAQLNQDRVVDLYWKTETEINSDYFTIEKSLNGTNWTFLESSNGAGTTTNVTNYLLKDETPSLGINYYRLSQTDLDGFVSYHGIRSVYLDQNENFEVYPNPTQSALFVSFKSKGEYEIYLFDLAGRIIYKSCVEQNAVIQMDLFAKGMYILKTNTGEEIKVVVE